MVWTTIAKMLSTVNKDTVLKEHSDQQDCTNTHKITVSMRTYKTIYVYVVMQRGCYIINKQKEGLQKYIKEEQMCGLNNGRVKKRMILRNSLWELEMNIQDDIML